MISLGKAKNEMHRNISKYYDQQSSNKNTYPVTLDNILTLVIDKDMEKPS